MISGLRNTFTSIPTREQLDFLWGEKKIRLVITLPSDDSQD